MKIMFFNKKLVLASMISLVVGTVGAVGAMAAVPSVQGTINGCYSNQNGLLKIIDQAGICSTGQTNLQWDKGMLAYAHLTRGVDSTGSPQLTIPAGQSHNVNMVASNPGIGLVACLDLDVSVQDKVRFVSLAPSVDEIDPQVLVKNKSQEESEGLSVYCSPEADVLIIGGGSAYISVY